MKNFPIWRGDTLPNSNCPEPKCHLDLKFQLFHCKWGINWSSQICHQKNFPILGRGVHHPTQITQNQNVTLTQNPTFSLGGGGGVYHPEPYKFIILISPLHPESLIWSDLRCYMPMFKLEYNGEKQLFPFSKNICPPTLSVVLRRVHMGLSFCCSVDRTRVTEQNIATSFQTI